MCAWVSGCSKKLATNFAAALWLALYGIATKLTFPREPRLGTNIRALVGSKPLAIPAAAAAGSNAIAISMAPSLNICCWIDSFSGKFFPARHRWGFIASYQRHNGAVAVINACSVAGCCNKLTSGVNSIKACFKKVVPIKLLTTG